jgi:hypothetical protein
LKQLPMTLIAIVTAALIGGVVGYFMGVCRDVSTTMFYTHVLNRGGRAVRSPAGSLGAQSL